jgi:uncharacterized low-complexity protein
MATSKKTSIAIAASAAMTAGLALSPSMASADSNPFVSAELSSGYMQLAEHHADEGKCGEAKCGADKMKEKMKEGNCGGDKMKEKMNEGNCGGDKAADKMKEGNCGGDKMKEKMDEATCGGNK